MAKRCSKLGSKICKAAIMASAIAIIVVLFSLPVLLYFIKIVNGVAVVNSNCSAISSWGSISSGCTAVPYTGSVCRDHLSTWQQCTLGQGDTVWVSDTEAMATAEAVLNKTFNGTNGAMNSLEFFCYSYFPLCNVNRSIKNVILPTREECTSHVDSNEWSRLLISGIAELNCTLFPEATPKEISSPELTPSVECRERFAFINNSCQPVCHLWEQDSHLLTVVLGSLSVLSYTVGLVTGISVIIISLIKYKKMFKFPSVSMLYFCIGFCILVSIYLLGRTSTETFYCSSLSLLESLTASTTFCTISGAIDHYFTVNISLWWLVHVIFLFYKVMWPFHARNTKEKNNLIHFIVFVIVTLVPIPAVCVVVISDKFSYDIDTFPPSSCISTEVIYFYSLTLIVNVIGCTGIILLFLVLWRVHKIEGVFKCGINLKLITTAEKKLIIVLFYFALYSFTEMIQFILYYSMSEQLESNILQHFSCESGGYIQGQCSRDSFENSSLSLIMTLTKVLFGMLPIVILIFVIDLEELKPSILIRRCKDRLKKMGK